FKKQAKRFKKFKTSNNTPENKNKECANTLKKKKKVLRASWSDEDTLSNSESDEEQVNNFVAFISSVLSSFEVETDDDFGTGFENEFLNTYKTIQSK
ncbi:hypothetical protein Gotri_003741, partial [Gossypium trilobum]|nr:hypothetical protein [Gossypium trilobum]